ncbi:MAG: hypothetical protein M3Y28_01960 [Armatimonadota bacterium]|nr:hypothetical protein [Armatimonadota bacterium]
MPITQDTESDGAGAGDLTRLGLAVYDAKLKPLLEPKDDGKFVAIHVDTEDYAVASSSGRAMRALLLRHPVDGRMVIRKIGPEPEYGLLARMIAGELMAGGRK